MDIVGASADIRLLIDAVERFDYRIAKLRMIDIAPVQKTIYEKLW